MQRELGASLIGVLPSGWNIAQLVPDGRTDVYKASIPGTTTGKTVEYFVSARDKSGRSDYLPRTAPEGVYVFSVL